MTGEPVRRLAAILFADVAGFTRMTEADEDGTLAALRWRRQSVVEPVIAGLGGRVVKHIGDGVMAEFASAVNAVAAAMRLHAESEAADIALPEDRRLRLRIGINLGDVVGEGDDLLGDGVNVASRLQALAEPGGIVVSAKVQAEVQGKLEVTFSDMGEQRLKNHTAPVRAYRVKAGSAAATPTADSGRLSVAVLPFTSLGADPDQQYFGDGVTEDIITELARLPVLHVASRNGSFRFRGPDADIAAAARMLGVRYVVEGSVRRMGPRLRITAQLIDTETGAHLWAERYDRAADEIFDVQDDVVHSIAGTVASRLQTLWNEESSRKPPAARTALDLAIQAERMSWQTAEDRGEAANLARQAIALDGQLARPHGVLAIVELMDWLRDLEAPEERLRIPLEQARMAVALAPNDFYSHIALASVYLYMRMHDLAEKHLEQALRLNPNGSGVKSIEAEVLLFSGRAAEGRRRLMAACDADPGFNPSWLWPTLAVMSYVDHDYLAALAAFRRIENPAEWTHAYAAAAHAMLGEHEAARGEVARVRAKNPAFAIALDLSRGPFRNQADRDHVAEGMRLAGLPD